jgi:L-xylulokinase
MKEHEAEEYRRIRWIFSCKDYIRFRLSGAANLEITDCSGSNFMNLHTRSRDRELLELMGIGEMYGRLPPLNLSADLRGGVSAEVARETGLAEGTPVAGGMFDIDACAIAAGVTDERRVCMIAGTWSINEYVRPAPVVDGSVL